MNKSKPKISFKQISNGLKRIDAIIKINIRLYSKMQGSTKIWSSKSFHPFWPKSGNSTTDTIKIIQQNTMAKWTRNTEKSKQDINFAKFQYLSNFPKKYLDALRTLRVAISWHLHLWQKYFLDGTFPSSLLSWTSFFWSSVLLVNKPWIRKDQKIQFYIGFQSYLLKEHFLIETYLDRLIKSEEWAKMRKI